MTIQASRPERLSGNDGVSKTPRFWLTAFWGFEPEHEGYYGFTLEGGRKRFLDNYQAGDLILVYGADVQNTAKADRKQVLGILEVEPKEIWDTDKISEHGLQEKRRLDKEDSWKYAVPVKRAWKLNRRISVGQVFPDTYLPGNGQALASFGMVVSEREARNIMNWPVTEVSVFGETPVQIEATEVSFEQALTPSVGPSPSFGSRFSTYEDGETLLYLFELTGDLANFLGKAAFELGDKRLIKVGRSNSVERRLSEINSGFPKTAKTRWKQRIQSKPFSNAQLADEAEKEAHRIFADVGQSQGNEFFLCSDRQIDTSFAKVVASTAFRITAPRRRI
jgi:T5orf172 domain